MERAKKKQIKKLLSWICIAALVAGLALMPLLAGSSEETEGPKASILSGTVGYGSITTEIHGGGILAASEAVDITIPSGVKITEFLVQNGDAVSQGDALATVDRVSVMTAITQVQETLDYLVEEMNGVTNEKASTQIKAKAGGRVKTVYGQVGEAVQDVMLRDGALAVLSLDGLMAVDIPCSTNLATGDTVQVTLSDGTQINGRVESNLNGTLVVTIEDDGYAVGEEAAVMDENGGRIGSGALYVHNAWKATAYTGTISQVHIEAEDTVSAGRNLFTLTDTEYQAHLNTLAAQHREYEALMLELFQMYQSDTIIAPCAGLVSGVDEDSVHLLADNGEGWSLTRLANAPNGNDETTYVNFVGMVTGMDSGSWNLALNPQSISIQDYKDLSGVPLEPAAMTQTASYIPTAPIYTLMEGQWQQIGADAITVGDILLFAGDSSGNFVWTVLVSHADITPENPDPTLPSEPEAPSEPDPSLPEETEPEQPGESTDSAIPGGTENIQIPSGSLGGMMGSIQQEPEFELYSLEGSTLMTISSGETMTLTITVDEQDISLLQVGQTAEIYIEALRNETFTAEITEVGTDGSNNGGSSKFTAELTLDRTENMLAGMNARASIPLFTTENVLTIPVEALVEDGAKTIVYTSCDSETGTLSSPVEVTVGISDGIQAQILSGLENGETYYYAYYDTLELSTAVEAENRFSFG